MPTLAALDDFLDSKEADGGIRTVKARQLVSGQISIKDNSLY
jgi:hypothetical protein